MLPETVPSLTARVWAALTLAAVGEQFRNTSRPTAERGAHATLPLHFVRLSSTNSFRRHLPLSRSHSDTRPTTSVQIRFSPTYPMSWLPPASVLWRSMLLMRFKTVGEEHQVKLQSWFSCYSHSLFSFLLFINVPGWLRPILEGHSLFEAVFQLCRRFASKPLLSVEVQQPGKLFDES
jgi:hypothetical protein